MPNLHPLFVHFPIVLLIACVSCHLIGLFWKNEFINKTSKWSLVFGTISLAAATFTGWLGHQTVPHSEISYPVIELHQKLAFISLGLFCIAVAIRISGRLDLPSRKWIQHFYTLILLLGLGFMVTTSYFGGVLVFEYGVGVKPVNHSQLEDSDVGEEFDTLFKSGEKK